MGRQSSYPEEFRKDAVAFYRAAAGKRTYAAVAADLGITAEVSADVGPQRPCPDAVTRAGARRRSWPGRTENAGLLKAEKEWQLEREILRRAAAYFAREVKFISDNRADFGVQRICRVLGISRSGYYRHLATAQVRAERQAEEKRTVSEIRAIHAEHHGAYGAPCIHAELRARGRRINRKRVPRLMRTSHIVGRHLRKKKRTTIADHTAPPPPDLVMRDFTANTLDIRWCGDITYIAVGAKWLHLATVIDI